MGLRERAELGDLRRRNDDLLGLIDRSRVENVLALEKENARLAAALADSHLLNEKLRASLKSASLRLEEHMARTPTPNGADDKNLALLKSPEVCQGIRAHLIDLYDEAGMDPLASSMRAGLAAMVRARIRGRELRPGTCHDLAKALHISHPGFFQWLIKRSDLISVISRDEKHRIIYSVHLERLVHGSDSPP